MKRTKHTCWRPLLSICSVVVVSLMTAAPAGGQEPGGASAVLTWINGDELPGELLAASSEQLTWRSPIFSQPLAIDLDALESIRAIAAPARREESAGPFRFELAGGNVLFGSPAAIDAEHILVKSPRQADVLVRRGSVTSIMRSGTADADDLSQAGGRGWQVLPPARRQADGSNRLSAQTGRRVTVAEWMREQAIPPRGLVAGSPAAAGRQASTSADLSSWNIDPAGQSSTTTPGARLYLPGELPEVCEIELVLSWEGSGAFTLSYASQAEAAERRGAFEIDTWADELVVQTAARPDDFERLLTLTPTTQSVHLRVIWNREDGKLNVYNERAELLAAMPGERKLDRAGATDSGLLLENKGSDLTVQEIRIRRWSSGQRPQPVAGRDILRTIAGREVLGTLVRQDPDGAVQVRTDDGSETRVELAELAEIAFAQRAQDAASAGNTRLTLFDGTHVQGQLASVTDGVARLETSFAEAEVAVSLAGLRELTLTSPSARGDAATSHVLRWGDRTLHGSLESAAGELGWRPVGSDLVIPISASDPVKIERAGDSRNVADVSRPALDVLYLKSGDQVLGRVSAIDQYGVRLETAVSDTGRIPADQLKAIEFNTQAAGGSYSFLDDRWQISRSQAETLERTENRVVFLGQATLSHPDLLEEGGVDFDVSWNPKVQSVLAMNLLSIRNGRSSSGLQFQFNLRQNQMQIHAITNGNNVRSYRIPAKEDVAKEASASIGISLGRGEWNLVVDGNRVASGPAAGPRTPITGLHITGQFANQAARVVQEVRADGRVFQRIVRQQIDPNAENAPRLTISNLRAGASTGLLRGMSLGEKDRTQFLTIPRSRRNNPPQHALMAKNGDLLRGQLLTLSAGAAQFRVGLEDVVVPRERLAGVVWLAAAAEEEEQQQQPEAGEDLEADLEADVEAEVAVEAEAAIEGTRLAVLRDGSMLRLAVEGVDGSTVVGRHPVLGLCRIALDEIDQLRTDQPQQTERVIAYTGWTLIHAKEPVIPGLDDSGMPFGTFSPLVGTEAEDFTLDLLDGPRFRLSDHRDKIVVLDFWATWCGPCVQAFPQLISATSQFSPDEVLFVAVNQQENADLIGAYLASHGFDATVALDRDGEVGQMFQVDGIPTTIVIDRGTIARVGLGATLNLEADLSAALTELLAPSDPAEPAD